MQGGQGQGTIPSFCLSVGYFARHVLCFGTLSANSQGCSSPELWENKSISWCQEICKPFTYSCLKQIAHFKFLFFSATLSLKYMLSLENVCKHKELKHFSKFHQSRNNYCRHFGIALFLMYSCVYVLEKETLFQDNALLGSYIGLIARVFHCELSVTVIYWFKDTVWKSKIRDFHVFPHTLAI